MPRTIRVAITDAMRENVPPSHHVDGHTFWANCCHEGDCLNQCVAYLGDPENPYESQWYCAEHFDTHAHKDSLSPEEVLRALKPLRPPLVYPETW